VTIPSATPVISIGNLAMGGRGKTPTVGLVARLLLEAGERPAILSRGYGRERPREGALIVSDGTHILADVPHSGDEPLMLARDVPGAAVVVCDVRAVAATLASRVLGATVHLLDDGFQHRALARDADIVIVHPADLDDRRLPFGRLRSPVRSLARADAVVIDADTLEPTAARVRALAPQAAVFTLRRTIGQPVPIEPDRPWPSHVSSVLALAAIAHPERFTRMLTGAGWTVGATIAYRDHHRFTPADLTRVAKAMHDAGAVAVLTTSKDAMRLLPLRPLPVPMAAVPLDVSLEPPEAFRAWLVSRVRGARA